MSDERLEAEDEESGTYPHGRALFVAHGLGASVLGVIVAVLVAGRHHSSATAGVFWLCGGAYLIGGAFTPRLRFGPVSVLRWRAAHARVRRGVARFDDRLVVAFDPYGRALNVVFGGGAVVYGLLRLAGRG
jgi:hypothetical protein